MATDKRERQRENRARRQAEEEIERSKNQQSATIQRFGILAAIIIAVLIVAFFLFGGDDDSDGVSVGDDQALLSQDELDQQAIDDAIEEPVEDLEIEDDETTEEEPATATDAAALFPADGDCPPEDGSGDRTTSFPAPQPLCIDLDATYTADVVTNVGDFTIEFDTQRAPVTVNNFITLARHRFYEGVNFHRVISGFMIQGGDAVGTPPGTGGPGYQFIDEPQGGEGPFYEIGSVAMANSGPNTNGSQFFVVTGPSGVSLPDQFNRFGTVTEGFETITTIEAIETDGGDAPLTAMTIESITITES